MGKKILAILGSPVKNGTIYNMFNYAVGLTEKMGYHVDKINLYDSDIKYCRGCFACNKLKRCVQNDDISKIEELLINCDIVLLASPVYWANVPAAVKNLFDRLRGTVMEETKTFPKPRLPRGKKYIFITACATPAPFSWIFGQSRGAVRAVNEFFKTAGIKKEFNYVLADSYHKNGISKGLKKKLESRL